MTYQSSERSPLMELELHRLGNASVDVIDFQPVEDNTGSMSESYRQLLTGLETILTETARRIEKAPGDRLPGIGDVVESIVLYTATAKRQRQGWYCPNAWHDTRSGQRYAEIVLNADNLDSSAEDILDTLVHELVHAYAEEHHLRDTSRRGSYHNGVFAELAIRAGLVVHRHPTSGCTTVGISPLGVAIYGDLIEPLAALLRLHRDPGPRNDPDPGGATVPPSTTAATEPDPSPIWKYVTAGCACINGHGRPVVIRVARGNWTEDTIWCRRCDHPFVDANTVLSESPQNRAA